MTLPPHVIEAGARAAWDAFQLDRYDATPESENYILWEAKPDAAQEHWMEHTETIIAAAFRAMWQPVEQVPDDARGLVAGWQKPSKGVGGYWWWGECDFVGKNPVGYPGAQMWCPVFLPLPEGEET